MDPEGCGQAKRWLDCPLGRAGAWGDDIITPFFLPNIILRPGPPGTRSLLARKLHKGLESSFHAGSA